MNAIIVGLIGAILSLGAILGYSEYQTLGALPLIQSAQLAASPSNGECLSTNGTVNDWTTCGVGGGLSTYDAFTHPIAGVSATTTPIRFTGGFFASSTVLIDNSTTTNATTTSLAILNLTSASCDVKASTAGVLSCGTDATGGASDYDAWTHPASGISATTSQIIISASSTIGSGESVGGLTVSGTATTTRNIIVQGTATSTVAGNLNIASTKKIVFGSSVTEGGSIMNWNEKGAINFLGDASASGKLSFSALGNALHASHNFFSFAAESGSAGTGAWNGILLNVTQTATPSGTKNLINLQTDATSQFSVSSAGTASTTALTVSSLNAANCDVKASTAGVLSCGTDATSAGAADDFTFETNFAAINAATTSILWAKSGINASSTSHFDNATSTLFTATTAWLTNLFIGADTIAEYIADTAGAFFTGNTETGITVTYQDADNTVDVVCNTADTATFGCLTDTDWDTFNGKENVLTAGDGLTRTANDIDFDGGDTPGGVLGGTWASPTLDDSYLLNNGDTGTGTYDFSGATVKQHTYSSFTYASTTAWAGTTTIPLGPAYTAESWSGVKCFTDVGTLNVDFNDGTNEMNLLNASTTVGSFTFSTNNTFTASEKRYVEIGTPASSPTKISCTVDKIVNN